MRATIRLEHDLVAVEGEHDVHAIAYAKRSAEWLAGRLHADDRLAIVDYDDEVRLLAPLAPVGARHTHALRTIQPGNQTNLSGGWLKGLEQLRGVEGARKILLLRVGIAPNPVLLSTAAGQRAAHSGWF